MSAVSIPGVDYPWSHPSPSSLRSAGKKFALRYLSHNASKNLSRAEATALAADGIYVGVVWESTADRPLSGRAAGIEDARTAMAQALDCGMPSGRPIYFAADFDVTESQQAAVNAYLDGAGSIIGKARTGVYGGYYTVKRALDGGHATWGWQTFAWSGGQWDNRAVLRQGKQATIGGVGVDLDTALAYDYGQWMPGRMPNLPEEDMALSAEDKTWIKETIDASVRSAVNTLSFDAVVMSDQAPAPLADTVNPNWTVATYLKQLYLRVLEAKDAAGTGTDLQALTDLRASVEALRTAVTDPTGFLDKMSEDLSHYTISIEKEV